MRKHVVNELRATYPAPTRPIHRVDVRGLIKDDAFITYMLVPKREFLPGLRHL